MDSIKNSKITKRAVLLQKTVSLTDSTNAFKVSDSIPEPLSIKPEPLSPEAEPLSPEAEPLPPSSFRGNFLKRSATTSIVFELYGFESFFASIGPSADKKVCLGLNKLWQTIFPWLYNELSGRFIPLRAVCNY